MTTDLNEMLEMTTENEIRSFMVENNLNDFDVYEFMWVNFHPLANFFASEDGED